MTRVGFACCLKTVREQSSDETMFTTVLFPVVSSLLNVRSSFARTRDLFSETVVYVSRYVVVTGAGRVTAANFAETRIVHDSRRVCSRNERSRNASRAGMGKRTVWKVGRKKRSSRLRAGGIQPDDGDASTKMGRCDCGVFGERRRTRDGHFVSVSGTFTMPLFARSSAPDGMRRDEPGNKNVGGGRKRGEFVRRFDDGHNEIITARNVRNTYRSRCICLRACTHRVEA